MKAIRVGVLIDGTVAPPMAGATICIEEGLITAVLPSIRAPLPDDATVIDAAEATVMPGMIDAHVHLRNPSTIDIAANQRYKYRIETEPDLAVFYAAHAAHITLMSGFTTLRNMGGIEYVALGKAIDAELIEGPRILTSGMVLMTGGHTDRTLPHTLPRAYPHAAWQTADGVDGVRKRVRELVFAGADFIKFDAGGGVHNPDIRLYSKAEIQAIVDEAHNLGVRVAAHAHGSEAILRAVTSGVDTLEHGTFMDDACIEEMAKRDTTFVPTLAIMHDSLTRGAQWGYSTELLDKYQRLHETRMQAVNAAYGAGVPIALGTDSSGWLAPHGRNAVEFQLLADAGLSRVDAVAAGTSVAANALGIGKLVGTIEPEKAADLVVLNSNPLDDLTSLVGPDSVRMVLRNGRCVSPPIKC